MKLFQSQRSYYWGGMISSLEMVSHEMTSLQIDLDIDIKISSNRVFILENYILNLR
jgi:hypothetical protein